MPHPYPTYTGHKCVSLISMMEFSSCLISDKPIQKENTQLVKCPCCLTDTPIKYMTTFIADGDELEICEGCAEGHANHGTVLEDGGDK